MSARQLHQDTDLRDDPGTLLAAALSSNAVSLPAAGSPCSRALRR